MLYTFVLVAHILTAVITIGLIGYTLYALVRKYDQLYRMLALTIGIVAAIEVATGTIIASLSPTVSLVSLIPHMTFYLAACLLVEGLIFRAWRAFQFFPRKVQ